MTTPLKLAALLSLLALGACETVGGAGQDIQSAGRFVQGSAQEVQNDL